MACTILSVKKLDESFNDNDKSEKRIFYSTRLWSQVVATVLIAWTHFAVGTVIGYPGVTLTGMMNSNSSDIVLTPSQGALFTSLLNFGAMAGSILSGPLTVLFGQRIVLLIALPIVFTMWIGLAFAHTVWLMQITRLLIGIAQGLIGGPASTYVVEIAHPKYRGNLYALIDVLRQGGSLFVFIVGSGPFTWREVAIICGVISAVIPFIGMLFIHNSPRWLATMGRFRQSEESLLFYRGSKANVDEELDEIKIQLGENENISSLKTQLRILNTRHVRNTMLVLSVLMGGTFFTGNNVITTYSTMIFEDLAHLNPYLSTVIIGIARVLGSLTYALVSEKFGRRPLFIIPLTISAISLLLFLLYQSLDPIFEFPEYFKWCPLIFLITFTVTSCMGIPVFMLYRSELLPNSVRSLGSSILYVVFFACNFITLYLYPTMVHYLNISGTFGFYAVCTIALVVFGYCKLPETKGKSLELITRETTQE